MQISRNADAFVDRNRVVDNVFPGFVGAEAGQASGFILFENTDSDIRLRDNVVQNNDTNLGLFNSDGGVFEENTVLDATAYDGILADADSAGNRFEDNTARRNAEHDCHDDSTGRGTAGTANVWRDNRGVTQNRPRLCKK